jgi:hypothetical protein
LPTPEKRGLVMIVSISAPRPFLYETIAEWLQYPVICCLTSVELVSGILLVSNSLRNRTGFVNALLWLTILFFRHVIIKVLQTARRLTKCFVESVRSGR